MLRCNKFYSPTHQNNWAALLEVCFKPRRSGSFKTNRLSIQHSDEKKFKTVNDIVSADQTRAKPSKTAGRVEKRKADIAFDVPSVVLVNPTCLEPILRVSLGGVCASISSG